MTDINKNAAGSDASGKEKSTDHGGDYEARFKGLQRKMQELTNSSASTIESLQAQSNKLAEQNEMLTGKLDAIVSAFGSVVGEDTDGDSDADADPMSAAMSRMDTLEKMLLEQQKAREDAEFEAKRTKMLAEFDLLDAADVVARADTIEKQREIVEKFASVLEKKKTSAKKDSGTPPKRTTPKGGKNKSSAKDLQVALTAAIAKGDVIEANRIRSEYYAALDAEQRG